jgi:hypothetical protein
MSLCYLHVLHRMHKSPAVVICRYYSFVVARGCYFRYFISFHRVVVGCNMTGSSQYTAAGLCFVCRAGWPPYSMAVILYIFWHWPLHLHMSYISTHYTHKHIHIRTRMHTHTHMYTHNHTNVHVHTQQTHTHHTSNTRVHAQIALPSPPPH